MAFKYPVNAEFIFKAEFSTEDYVAAEDCVCSGIVHEKDLRKGAVLVKVKTEILSILRKNAVNLNGMQHLSDSDLRSGGPNYWKVGSSKIEGYYKNYSITTDAGDQIEVDFNYSRSLARILLRLDAENGREYIAVIKSGTIIQERELSSRRAVNMSFRMEPQLPYFRILQDEALLRTLGGVYGIPVQPERKAGGEAPSYYGPNGNFEIPSRTLALFTRIREHLKKKKEQEANLETWWERFMFRLPDEALDLGLGAILILAYLQGYLNHTYFIGFIGFWGIFSGAFDWLWRQRSPFLPKVAALLALSGLGVWQQVQYRIWSIFI